MVLNLSSDKRVPTFKVPMYIIPSLNDKLKMRGSKGVLRKVFFCLIFFYVLTTCLRIFLPRSIRSTDLMHLAQIVMEWQDFPLEELDDSFDNKSIPVSVNKDKLMRYLKSWKTNVDFTSKSVIEEFQQPMGMEDRQNMLYTLEAFTQACDLSNLTYFIIGGTLLGSYRHHGFIPWDDDIDVAVNASEWRKLRHVLSHVPGFSLYTHREVQWKFYMDDILEDPKVPFKWPNVDIFFFTEDDTYIWGLTTNIKDKLFEKKTDLFPLQYRPFENLQIAVPCNMEDLILKEFDTETCVSGGYSHKYSKTVDVIKTKPCKELHHAYPFVFRSITANGDVRELLRVGDKVLSNTTLPRGCV